MVSTMEFWLGDEGIGSLSSPFLNSCNIRAGFAGFVDIPATFALPRSEFFSPVIWSPWPTVNNNSRTQDVPSCLLLLKHSSPLKIPQKSLFIFPGP